MQSAISERHNSHSHCDATLDAPPEQPGPVVDLKAKKTNKDSIILAWKKPISDGGSHISAYIVDQSEGDKWKEISKGKNTSLTIGDLTEGKEYLFRVTALNESGMGPPSEIAAVAKDQFGKNCTLLSPCDGKLPFIEGDTVHTCP